MGWDSLESKSKKSKTVRSEDVISPLDSQVSVRVIHTDEERMIAKSVGRVVGVALRRK